MANWELKSAEAARQKITKAQVRQIRTAYEHLADNAAREAASLRGKDNVSSIIRQQYLKGIEKQLDTEVASISKELSTSIQKNMQDVATATVEESREYLKSIGMPAKGAWSHVPTQIVKMVSSGQIYAGNWSLSKAIWGMQRKTIADIQSVVSQGIAANKSAFDIAKDLEQYVDPSAKKGWDWSKVYPGTSRKIDYSAQRLARTMVSHAYQQSFQHVTQNNPFVQEYIWRASMGDRTCPICMDRNGRHYKKNELPLDHPMGMCTFIAVMDDANDIADKLANWVNSPDGTYSDIDKFAKSLYPAASVRAVKKNVKLK